MKHVIMAPLRGFTDVVFRNAYQQHFKGVGEAIAPFVTSVKGRRIKTSHLKDLSPDENQGMPVVPQVLGNDAEQFICLANALIDLGYREINWNLGCPYPMVAKKMRGSGLLPHPDIVDSMLEAIHKRFAGLISIKTRLGRFGAKEMAELIPVFNRYPLLRLIVHPRTGVQMYTGQVDLAAYEDCLRKIVHPVIYNGDIDQPTTFRLLESRFPDTHGWMIGRGLLTNPFLPEMIQTGQTTIRSRDRFARFHDDLVEGYCHRFSGPGHVLDRMKGFWGYFSERLAHGRKLLKQIRKTNSLARYHEIVSKAFEDCEFI